MIIVGIPAGSKDRHKTRIVMDSGAKNFPKPTTDRGWRRHEKRNEAQRKHAESAWRG